MLATMVHALSEDMVEYDGRAALPVPDHDLYGMNARYRLYEAADRWVFLAAPADDEWAALVDVFALARRVTSRRRRARGSVVRRLPRQAGRGVEAALTNLDVACVEVARGAVEDNVWFRDHMGDAFGIVCDQEHPVIGAYRRLKPLASFSRSTGLASTAPMLGEHTDTVLAELGFDGERIFAAASRRRARHLTGTPRRVTAGAPGTADELALHAAAPHRALRTNGRAVAAAPRGSACVVRHLRGRPRRGPCPLP